jgi:hypothetical protein
MKVEEFKALTKSVKEMTAMSRERGEISASLKSVGPNVGQTKNLWKHGRKPLLIQAGLALIVFPEPFVSDVLGTSLLAAGAVQEGIKRQSVFIDDMPKAFNSAMKTLRNSKDLI